MKKVYRSFTSLPLSLRILSVCGAVLCVLFLTPLLGDIRSGIVGGRPPFPEKPWQHVPMTPPSEHDVAGIRPWMTFAFLAERFTLSSDEFATVCNVRSARYPDVTLRDAAKDIHSTPQALVACVQSVVRSHLQK